MLRPHVLAAAAALAAFAGPAVADMLPGYDRITVAARHRPGPLAASIWYPAATATYRGLIGDNAVFRGVPALVGPAPATGRRPLVVLSHGSGGNMDGLAWLASALAARGALVLGVNHPGSTTGDSSPRRSLLLHERAADLSAVLDGLLDDPTFGPLVDRDRVTALGFSLGGATVLGLVGARFDRAAFAAYCARPGERGEDCAFFERGGVDALVLPDAVEGDLRDPRFGAAVAVDPGLTHAFTAESVRAIDGPVLFINLGREHRFRAADVGPAGSGLAALVPGSSYEVVAPAHHFTFLARCKREGARLLAEEEDDPVCDDPEGSERSEVHARIIEIVAGWIGLRR